MPDPMITQQLSDVNTLTTIINNLNTLYSTAISQLTAYTLGIVGLVGVIIPLLITFFQFKSLKAEKDYLQNHISDEILKAKLEIRSEMLEELANKIKTEEENVISAVEQKLELLDKKIKIVDASTFHIQGNGRLSEKEYAYAAEDFCCATSMYLTGGDELNGQRTLDLLVTNALPKVNKTEFEEFELEKNIERVIKILISINTNKKYSDQINALKKARRAASAREE